MATFFTEIPPTMAPSIILSLLLLISATLSAWAARYNDGCIVSLLSTNHHDVIELYSRNFQASPDPVQGLHLSLDGEESMRITWLNPRPFYGDQFHPQCRYGTRADVLKYTSAGTAYTYSGGNFNLTLNSALLDLTPLGDVTQTNKAVFYKCGDNNFGWSGVKEFKLQPKSVTKHQRADDTDVSCDVNPRACFFSDLTPTIAAIGDLSVDHGKHTITSLSDLAKIGKIQLLIHAGDITYADRYGGHTRNNSYVWVDYMNKMEPIASRVPYMTAPGNHESEFNFTAYVNWFKMPSIESYSSSPFWYSFDYMGIHFLSFSTEHDFMQNSTQFHWMESDLKTANRNRGVVPWIMVFGHRPLYCTSIICKVRCEAQAPIYRSYIEDLLYEQKVDVYLSGHNHQYERSLPVYKQKAVQEDYKNPKAPVYIVNGGAGKTFSNYLTLVVCACVFE